MNLHHKLDCDYGETGDDMLRQALASGVDVNARSSETSETLMHVVALKGVK